MITAPITVDDNAVTLIGNPTTASPENTTSSAPGSAGGATTAVANGENSIAGGTQATPVITAPVGIQDNAVTLIGNSTTGSTDSTPSGSNNGSAGGATIPITDGENSLAGGTQVAPVVTAPIAVEDNAITVIGGPATGSADADGTANGNAESTAGQVPVTNGEDSIAGGTQIIPVITAPITADDNAITVIGDPTTGSTDSGGTPGTNGGTTAPAPVTDGEDSVAGGTQITPVINAPVGVEDNAITLIGNPTTGSTDSTTASAPGPADGSTTAVTNGENSIAGGTQITPVINAPIAVDDNAITVIGDPATGSTDADGPGSGNAEGSIGSSPVTDGENSIGGGTQITPVITAPIAVEGNMITVIGDPTTSSGDTTTGGTSSTGTDGGIMTPVIDDNGLGAGAGAEGTVGVGGADGAAVGGTVTADGTVTAGGTLDADSAGGLTLGAASQGFAVAGGSSFDHRVAVASSSVSAVSSSDAGIGTGKMGHRGATATPGGVLAHTGATSSMVAGIGMALMVAGAVLLLAGRRRAARR